MKIPIGILIDVGIVSTFYFCCYSSQSNRSQTPSHALPLKSSYDETNKIRAHKMSIFHNYDCDCCDHDEAPNDDGCIFLDTRATTPLISGISHSSPHLAPLQVAACYSSDKVVVFTEAEAGFRMNQAIIAPEPVLLEEADLRMDQGIVPLEEAPEPILLEEADLLGEAKDPTDLSSSKSLSQNSKSLSQSSASDRSKATQQANAVDLSTATVDLSTASPLPLSPWMTQNSPSSSEEDSQPPTPTQRLLQFGALFVDTVAPRGVLDVAPRNNTEEEEEEEEEEAMSDTDVPAPTPAPAGELEAVIL